MGKFLKRKPQDNTDLRASEFLWQENREWEKLQQDYHERSQLAEKDWKPFPTWTVYRHA